MWRITLTMTGETVPVVEVRAALARLAEAHPFLLTARYAADRAQIEYWEEAADVHDAAALALRLWGEHRVSSGLPPWRVAGLELVDRDTWLLRRQVGSGRAARPSLARAGSVRPF